MAGSGSAGSTGQSKPSTRGETYGRQVFEEANTPERIFSLGVESVSVLIQAHPDNAGRVFIGFDDGVDSNTGIVISPENNISIDLDLDKQNLYGVANNANDEIRFLVTS